MFSWSSIDFITELVLSCFFLPQLALHFLHYDLLGLPSDISAIDHLRFFIFDLPWPYLPSLLDRFLHISLLFHILACSRFLRLTYSLYSFDFWIRLTLSALTHSRSSCILLRKLFARRFCSRSMTSLFWFSGCFTFDIRFVADGCLYFHLLLLSSGFCFGAQSDWRLALTGLWDLFTWLLDIKLSWVFDGAGLALTHSSSWTCFLFLGLTTNSTWFSTFQPLILSSCEKAAKLLSWLR